LGRNAALQHRRSIAALIRARTPALHPRSVGASIASIAQEDTMPSVKSPPEGYHSLTPYLIVAGAAKAIDFYKSVFGAVERMRLGGPDGRIGHAELTIGNSVVMLADENPAMGANAPGADGSPVGLLVYVADVDAVAAKAVAAGGKLTRPVENQFYGDRLGSVVDPFGHLWHISTHVEDVSGDEIARRAAALAQQHKP
jgi:PhnB protein